MKELLSETEANIVLEILSKELGVSRDQLTSDAKLEEDLGADSLDLVEISMALEDRLGMTIPDERSDQLATVGDLFELVSELLQERR